MAALAAGGRLAPACGAAVNAGAAPPNGPGPDPPPARDRSTGDRAPEASIRVTAAFPAVACRPSTSSGSPAPSGACTWSGTPPGGMCSRPADPRRCLRRPPNAPSPGRPPSHSGCSPAGAPSWTRSVNSRGDDDPAAGLTPPQVPDGRGDLAQRERPVEDRRDPSCLDADDQDVLPGPQRTRT